MVTGSSPDPGGVRAVISSSEITLRLVACRSPTHSVLTWPRSWPLMTISVDPEAGPSEGVDRTEGDIRVPAERAAADQPPWSTDRDGYSACTRRRDSLDDGIGQDLESRGRRGAELDPCGTSEPAPLQRDNRSSGGKTRRWSDGFRAVDVVAN